MLLLILVEQFLPGSSGPATPCTDIRGLQRLLTILGGKVSEDYRSLLNETFLRYLAGDHTMITEIKENAASDAPANVLARDALARPPTVEAPEELHIEVIRSITSTLAEQQSESSRMRESFDAALAQQAAFVVSLQASNDAERRRLLEDLARSNADRDRIAAERDHANNLRHQVTSAACKP